LLRALPNHDDGCLGVEGDEMLLVVVFNAKLLPAKTLAKAVTLELAE
jgi:hypothetical protein